MSPMLIFLSVLLAGFAVSYGWGVRGFVIGGEKGALLPGALFGLVMSSFVFGEKGIEYFHFFAAAGALSMFYGGTETYAQTMSYLLSRDVKGPYYGQLKKGVVGIFLKGGLWFAIPGLVLSMLTGALSGKYNTWDIIIMFALFPLVSVIGTKIFNTPYDKKEKKFPKLYFSLDRREEWGSNVLIIAVLIIFTLIRGDFVSFGAGIFGFITGGMGFLLGLILYDIERRSYGKKKRRVFGRLSEKGYIDGWKIMEHAFGAFSGGALMLYFMIFRDEYMLRISETDISALPLSDKGTVMSVVPLVLLLLTALQYPVSALAERKNRKIDTHIFELLERPMWSAVPLIFIFLGSYEAAVCCSFMTLAYALCEKCSLEYFRDSRYKRPLRAVFAVLWVVLTVWFCMNLRDITALELMLLYTVGYTSACVADTLLPDNVISFVRREKNFRECFGSGFTVTGHLVVQCIILVIILLSCS